MKLKSKKVLIAILAGTMILGTSMNVFAEDVDTNSAIQQSTEETTDWTDYLKKNCTIDMSSESFGKVKRGQTVSRTVSVTNNGERTIENLNVDWKWGFLEIDDDDDETSEAMRLKDSTPSVVIESIAAGETKTVTLTNTIPMTLAEKYNRVFGVYAMASYQGGADAIYTNTATGAVVASDSNSNSGDNAGTNSNTSTVNKGTTAINGATRTNAAKNGTTLATGKSPKTGEEANMLFVACIMIIAGSSYLLSTKKQNIR